MPILVFVVEDRRTLLQIPHHDGIGLIQQDTRTIDGVDDAEVREERGILAQRRLEDEVELDVRGTIQATRVIHVETVKDAIGKLVIAGSVTGVLKALSAHAHDDAVGATGLIAAENVKVIQVSGLVFEKQGPVAVTSGKSAGHQHQGGRSHSTRTLDHWFHLL